MKSMKIWYDMAGTVIVDTVSSEAGFSSQYHPDGHLLVTFKGATGTVQTETSSPMTSVKQARYAKPYRTVQF